MTDEPKDSTKATIDRAKEDLKRIRDEIELKAGLAKLEARKAAERLEPHVKKIEGALDEVANRAGDVVERARLQATLAASEAKSEWPGFESAADHVLNDIRSELKKTTSALDADKTVADVQEKLSALKKKLFG